MIARQITESLHISSPPPLGWPRDTIRLTVCQLIYWLRGAYFTASSAREGGGEVVVVQGLPSNWFLIQTDDAVNRLISHYLNSSSQGQREGQVSVSQAS